ncbi:hypothetical protein BaRGS_00017194 [Batillaria attramentaria]|uniref:THAP-type domain-containing protein n=1 Tax=Batillaria attramentaria TaxID=370345 RepID=A0ABD0KWJ8_9CAEN
MEGKKLGNRHCCYGQCNSDERYPHRCEDVSFIPFPKPKTRLEDCKAWIKMCGRPHDQLNPSLITKNYFVCSKGKPTTEFPYPVPYDGRPVQRGRKRRNEATPESYTTSKKGRSCTAQSLQPDSQSVQPESEVPAAASVTDISGMDIKQY